MGKPITTARPILMISLWAAIALWVAPAGAMLNPRLKRDEGTRTNHARSTRQTENELTASLQRSTEDQGASVRETQRVASQNIGTAANRRFEVDITDMGPDGGLVSGLEGILVNRRNPRQILAVAFHNSVFKSTDRGMNWFRSNNGLTDSGGVLVDVTNIRQDPSSPTTVYALATSLDTLFRSTDFGDSWIPLGSIQSVAADFAVHPTSPNIIYVLSDLGALFRSTDGGVTFGLLGNGLPADSGGYTNIVVTPSNPSVMYVADSGNFDGVYKSTDAGLNFTRLDSSPAFPLQVFPHPTDPNMFFAQTWSGSTGLSRTVDGGATFTEVAAGLPAGKFNSFVAFDSRNASVVYVAGEGGLFRSTDGGSTFTSLALSLNQSGAVSVTVDPLNSDVIYVNTFEGNFKSTNGGRTFVSLNHGFKASWINVLTFDNRSDPTLYAGNVIGDSFLRTKDRGERYDLLGFPPGEGAIQSAAVAETDRRFIVVATSGGIFRSTDRGRTWAKATTDTGETFFNAPQVAIDPHNGNNVYVTNDLSEDGSLFRSMDGGLSFVRSTGGLSFPDFRSVAIDPGNSLVILAQVSHSLFRSADGGITFSQIAQSVFLYDSQIVINPQNSQEIFLAGDLGIILSPPFLDFGARVLRSEDGGATFTPAESGLPVINGLGLGRIVGLLLDAKNPSRVFLWFREGLYMSEDGAQSWTPLDTGETIRRSGFGKAAAMAINPDNSNLLYLGGASILEVEIKDRGFQQR